VDPKGFEPLTPAV